MTSIATKQRQNEWKAVIERIREAERPDDSRAFAELYELALVDIVPRLQSRFHNLGDADCTDIVLDKFTATWRELIDKNTRAPRRFFTVSCARAAISRLRKIATAQRKRHLVLAAVPLPRTQGDIAHSFDLAARWAELTPKTQAILTAAAMGVSRKDIARSHDTTLDAINKIISRARKPKETP